MRALLSTQCGGPDMLELLDVDQPEPVRGEVRIRVETCGINYPDVLIIEDRYQVRPPRPFSPGGEVSGRIDKLGEGVEGFAVGDRVAALTYIGGLAELVCAPVANVMHIPDDIDGAIAAMLLTTYATSWHALVDRGGISAGQRVLVLGAGGGVGLAAVEIAAALGATVIAAASSQDKLDAAVAAGAATTVLYPSDIPGAATQRSFAGQFKKATGPDGADLIYDPVGGWLAEPALRAIAWEGRYLVVGFPAGIPALPFNLALLKGCSIVGVFMGEFAKRDPAASQRNFDALFGLHAEGKLKPLVSGRFLLAKGGEAIAKLGARAAIGKLVVAVR